MKLVWVCDDSSRFEGCRRFKIHSLLGCWDQMFAVVAVSQIFSMVYDGVIFMATECGLSQLKGLGLSGAVWLAKRAEPAPPGCCCVSRQHNTC